MPNGDDDRRINLSQLREFIARFGGVLDRVRFKSWDDFARHSSPKRQRIGVHGGIPGTVVFSTTKSLAGNPVYSIRFVVGKYGTVCELRANPTEGYSKVRVRVQGEIGGYTPYWTDSSGNVAQEKGLDSVNFESGRKELEGII